MSEYVIISDSTTDLPLDIVEKYNLEILPLKVTIDNKTYANFPNQSEITNADFYKFIRDGKTSITTQVNVGEFEELFEKHLKNGTDILYLGFSSNLSGTYQASTIARNALQIKYPDRKIICVDSLCASLGEGLLLYYAAQKKAGGANIYEVASFLEDTKLSLCHYFTVDDLFYLKRGGRVSGATAAIGTVLGIKPLMHVDNEGSLVAYGKIRGRKQSLTALVKKIEDNIVDPKTQSIFISHGDCLEEAEYVAKQIKQAVKPKEIIINHVGPVVGAHSGPGTMAVFFIAKDRSI